MPDGTQVHSFLLRNASGAEVRFLDYGGTIHSIVVPDRDGVHADVTPGYDTFDDYLRDSRYFGALIGRVANRIANGRFTLDGHEYSLDTNEGTNHLHGGTGGFHRVVWGVEVISNDGAVAAVLTHTSPAGDQGYPGTVKIRVTYVLTDTNELCVEYLATTDRPTPINLTQHTYFNLSGHDAGSVLNHELTLNASRFMPVDARRLPTGELHAVTGTPFDFRSPRAIGAAIHTADEQLRLGNGYDHNWVLEAGAQPSGTMVAARVRDPASGRTLDVETTQPGMQFYSGNGIAGGPRGKGGHEYAQRSSFALESQHFPDSPNQPSFPTIILRPHATYQSRTVYRFGVAD